MRVVRVCGLCVWSVCVVYVCGPCVWSMCVVRVCGLCVWSVCVVYVCGPCVWSMCVVRVCDLCVGFQLRKWSAWMEDSGHKSYGYDNHTVRYEGNRNMTQSTSPIQKGGWCDHGRGEWGSWAAQNEAKTLAYLSSDLYAAHVLAGSQQYYGGHRNITSSPKTILLYLLVLLLYCPMLHTLAC